MTVKEFIDGLPKGHSMLLVPTKVECTLLVVRNLTLTWDGCVSITHEDGRVSLRRASKEVLALKDCRSFETMEKLVGFVRGGEA